jgi:hypothetical protein
VGRTGKAVDPAHGRFRADCIEAGTHLFGTWPVDATYGRIGTTGRTVRHIAADEADARKIVRRCLRRRATAPHRLGGLAYQLREVVNPGHWLTA